MCPLRPALSAFLRLRHGYLQPLQLLHVIKRPSFHHSNLVLHQLPGEAKTQGQLRDIGQGPLETAGTREGNRSSARHACRLESWPESTNSFTTLQILNRGSSARPALTARFSSSPVLIPLKPPAWQKATGHQSTRLSLQSHARGSPDPGSRQPAAGAGSGLLAHVPSFGPEGVFPRGRARRMG